MKRVKLMLSAIAVLAVVGGALAFKAKTPNFHLYRSINNTCSIIDPAHTYTLDEQAPLQEFVSVTTSNIQGSATTGVCDFALKPVVE